MSTPWWVLLGVLVPVVVVMAILYVMAWKSTTSELHPEPTEPPLKPSAEASPFLRPQMQEIGRSIETVAVTALEKENETLKRRVDYLLHEIRENRLVLQEAGLWDEFCRVYTARQERRQDARGSL